MGLADDYMKQVNQYDSGKPNTAVPSRGKTGTVIASNAAKPRPYAPEARPAAPATSGAAKAVDLFNNYSEFSGKNAAPSRNAAAALGAARPRVATSSTQTASSQGGAGSAPNVARPRTPVSTTPTDEYGAGFGGVNGTFAHGSGFFGGNDGIPRAKWAWKGGDPHRPDWTSSAPQFGIPNNASAPPSAPPLPTSATRGVFSGAVDGAFQPTTFSGAVNSVVGPGPVNPVAVPSNPVGPGKFALDQTALRGSAMKPTGGTPLLSQDATGKVGWFGADGRPTQPGFNAKAGLPAGSALATSPNNYTAQLNADGDIFKAQMAALNRGESLGPMYTPQGQPGGGTYQQDSFMDRLSSQRDALSKRVGEIDASAGISSSSSIGDIISHQMKTKSLRDEIKSIDTQLLGRSELANKIQLAILQNLGAQTVQGMKESGDDRRTAANNNSLFDVHSMRENMETKRSVMNNMSNERIASWKVAADDAAAKQKAGEKNTDFVNGINKDAMMKIIEANIPKDGGAVDPKSIAELTRKTYSAFYPDTEKKDELTKGIL